MRKRRKIISVKEFSFTITEYDDECATVVMKTGGVDFDGLIVATKYMMWIVSKSTWNSRSFDETIEFLARGAKTFTGAGLTVLPEKKPDATEGEE